MRIRERWRLPGVDQSWDQLLPSNSFSSAIVCWISSNSTLTKASFSSPWAWTYARTFLAFSSLPFEMSQRGDSGTVLRKMKLSDHIRSKDETFTYQMRPSWHKEGRACRRQGTRHPQAPTSMWFVPKFFKFRYYSERLSRENIPKATQAPIKLPTYHRELYILL